jgi:hypothetical protein
MISVFSFRFPAFKLRLILKSLAPLICIISHFAGRISLALIEIHSSLTTLETRSARNQIGITYQRAFLFQQPWQHPFPVAPAELSLHVSEAVLLHSY